MQFWSLEAFFRGFFIFGLRRRFGYYSVIIMTIPYCMIHFNKPITETLGAGASVVLDPKQTGSLFDSSIPILNMHTLELLAYYIDPPRWPAARSTRMPATS